MNLNFYIFVIFLILSVNLVNSQNNNSSILSDFLDIWDFVDPISTEDYRYEDYLDYSDTYSDNFESESEIEPIIKIPQGYISGVHLQTNRGKNYSGFYGIPYAKAKRFENPTKADNWNEIRFGDTYGPICLQFDMRELEIVGSEDCLTANIFTPKLPKNGKPVFDASELSRLPVLVHIHGGFFTYESSAEYQPDYLLNEDIILVTFNHRVGPFGYLSTGDSTIPGNFGLKDQVALLQWVQENIEYFGGDSSKVTIFGQNSGGVSVSLHILSQQSKGLFHRAIIQSGNALCNWAISQDSGLENAKKLAGLIGCPFDNSQNFLNCLKSRDADEIVTFMPLFYDWLFLDPLAPFSPTIEPPNIRGGFLTQDPEKIWSFGEINSVPLIIGMNQDEGKSIQSDTVLSNEYFTSQLNDTWNLFGPITLNYEPSIESSKIIRKFYFGHEDISEDTRENLENLYSDRNFGSCTRQAAILHSKRNPTFLYLFKYGGEFEDGKYTGHGDELIYLFNNDNYFSGDIPEYTGAEKMSKKMTSLFSSFALNGSPSSEPNWKEMSQIDESTHPSWYTIDLENSQFEKHNDIQSRLDFWTRFKNNEINAIPEEFSKSKLENDFGIDVPLLVFNMMTDLSYSNVENEHNNITKREVNNDWSKNYSNEFETKELVPAHKTSVGRVKRQTTIIRFIFRRVYGLLRVVLQTLGFFIENGVRIVRRVLFTGLRGGRRLVGGVVNGAGNIIGNGAGVIARRFRGLASGYRNRARGRIQGLARSGLTPNLRFPRLRGLGGVRARGRGLNIPGVNGRNRLTSRLRIPGLGRRNQNRAGGLNIPGLGGVNRLLGRLGVPGFGGRNQNNNQAASGGGGLLGRLRGAGGGLLGRIRGFFSSCQVVRIVEEIPVAQQVQQLTGGVRGVIKQIRQLPTNIRNGLNNIRRLIPFLPGSRNANANQAPQMPGCELPGQTPISRLLKAFNRIRKMVVGNIRKRIATFRRRLRQRRHNNAVRRSHRNRPINAIRTLAG